MQGFIGLNIKKNILWNLQKCFILFFISAFLNAQETNQKENSILNSEIFFREFNENVDINSIFHLIENYNAVPEGEEKADIDFVLSHYYASIFDYSKSYNHLKKARDLYFKYKKWSKYVHISKDIAIVLRHLGRKEDIEDVLLEALTIAKEKNVGYTVLKPLHEITIHYSYDLNQPVNAINYGVEFIESLKKYDSLGITDKHFLYSKTVDLNIVYLELGNSYIQTGQLDKGKMYLEKALDFFENDHEKSLRIYSHLINWSIKSSQSNDTTLNYINNYQSILKQKQEEEKSRLQVVSKELESLKVLQDRLEKESYQNQALKKQRFIIIISFSFLLILTLILIVALKRYNKSQKRLNEKLTNEKILLENIDRDRNMYLSIIAHELRTPVFTAKGLLDTIVIDDESDNESLVQVKSAINYLSSTIGNILSMPILKNKNSIKNCLSEKEFPIVAYVKEVITNYSYLASQKRIELKLSVDPHISDALIVYGVKENLGQVLSNLIHNAIKFSPPNDIVTISLFKEQQANEKISIKFLIQDHGPGVSKNLLNKIFQYRKKEVSDDTKNTALTEGLGIGLYVVKRILKTQNSAIYLDSSKGKGSSFYFTLDFKMIRKESINKAEGDKENVPSRLNILIIDDNKLNGLVAKKIVDNLNHHCYTCTDEEDFLQIIDQKAIDLVITDINMPKVNGYEVTKLIKNIKNIPVLAHTAADDISMDNEFVKESKLDGILIKPYTKEDLDCKIKEVMS